MTQPTAQPTARPMTRTFDCVPEFDIRSRMFGVANRPGSDYLNKPPISMEWVCPTYLDQGAEGACVGFACAHERAAEPTPYQVTETDARDIYHIAQKHDSVPGEDYSGTSLLGGARALLAMGYISEYQWCFGLRDVIMTIGYRGGVVLGINWYTGMHTPSKDGLIRPTGDISGGHAIFIKGVDVDHKYGILHNSWGEDWGDGGNAYILFSDLEMLLAQGGQAMYLVDKAA